MAEASKAKGFGYWLLIIITCALGGCGGSDSTDVQQEPMLSGEFSNPQMVTILGYSGDAMEPALSPDGQYLFFNNSNDPAINTNLHWARRVDDLTFQYQGEISGVNTSALEGVASMDSNNVFYFITTRNYVAPDYSTIYRGTFANGSLSSVEVVSGVSAHTAGMVNFDAEISADGNTLYFVDSQFVNGVPQTADIVIAERNGQTFSRAVDSAAMMQQINTSALEYAPTISSSGLEIFFTRLEGATPAIYVATRSATSTPFGQPKKIQAITGFVEGPTLSADEKSLYYHKKENNLFVIYRVKRP